MSDTRTQMMTTLRAMHARLLVNVPYLSPSQSSTLTLCERRWWHKIGGMKEEPTEALAMGGGLAEAHEFGIERGIEEYHARRPIPDPVFTSPDELSVESEPQGIRNVDACRSYGRPCPALEMCHERGA